MSTLRTPTAAAAAAASARAKTLNDATDRVVVRVKRVDQRPHVTSFDDLSPDDVPVTHDGQDAGAENLDAMSGTLTRSNAWRAAMTGDRCRRRLLMSQSVLKHGQQDAGVALAEHAKRR